MVLEIEVGVEVSSAHTSNSFQTFHTSLTGALIFWDTHLV